MSEHLDGCPESERLAAFVDGKLSAAARSEMIRHLDRCPVCRGVVSESVEVLARAVEAGIARRVGGGARILGLPRWAAAAAVVGALLLAGWLWRGASTPALPRAGEYLAAARALDDAGSVPDVAPGGRVYAFSGELAPARRAFRTGLRLVALELAAVRRDDETARRMLPEIAGLVGSFPGGAALAERWQAVAAGQDTRALVVESVDLVESAGEATTLALGAWCQLTRAAAAAGAATDPRAEAARFRTLLGDAALPPGIGRTLRDIEVLGDSDADRLRRRLGDLVDVM